ncbi:MAG: hypothetical protein KGL59_14575 [Acidobacteriota bacterium]|nr:hypothetical protein [Acidobacteriota bacterium]
MRCQKANRPNLGHPPLILLVAGFLALAQNPPLVVLTVAFWFAAAVVILERQRPRHGSRRPQKPDQH